MRQLLLVAIETDEPLSTTHLNILVPRLIRKARGYGVLLDDAFRPKQVVEAAKECFGKLPDEQNVGILPELSPGEQVQLGLRALADFMPMIEDLRACVDLQRG